MVSAPSLWRSALTWLSTVRVPDASTQSQTSSSSFSRVSTDKVDSDIYADATLYNNEQFNMASAIITGVTFFIIPSTAKNTFTLGRADYQRQYEPILYGWPEGATRHWCGDRDQGDVWHFNKPRVNDLHPTMKPVELVERAIRNSSRPGDVVLDPFGGSGTTLIAAEKSGRQARLIELDPKYCDVVVRRWQEYAGAQAVREADGVKFDDLVGTADAIGPADAEEAL